MASACNSVSTINNASVSHLNTVSSSILHRQFRGYQRKCFLIDSLLEERQKKLAANQMEKKAIMAKDGEQVMPDLEEKEGRMINRKLEERIEEERDDGEEPNEELLPNLCNFDRKNGQQNKTEEVKREEEEEKEMNDEKERPAEEENEEEAQKNALLDVLAKLVPAMNEEKVEEKDKAKTKKRFSDRNDQEGIERSTKRMKGHLEDEEEDREEQEEKSRNELLGGAQQQHQQQHSHAQPNASTTSVPQMPNFPGDFLQRFRFFQQHLSLPITQQQTHPQMRQWPMMHCADQIRPNFFRPPFLPSSSNFANQSNIMPKIAAPWQSLMQSPTLTRKCDKSEEAKQQTFQTAQGSATMAAAAMLASIGAFRAAAAMSAYPPPAVANGNSRNHFANATHQKKSQHFAESLKKATKTQNQLGKRQQNANSHLPLPQRINTTAQTKRSAICGTSRSSNVKKYRCDICETTFSRSNTLITHKRIHTGEKPFRCEHCGRAFRQPGNLTRHAYTHTTVKPFVCTECGKAFNRASNLQSHIRVHALSGEETAGEGGSGSASASASGSGSASRHQCKQCLRHFGTRSEQRAHKC